MRFLLSLVALSVMLSGAAKATVISYPPNLVGSSVFFNSISENPSINPTPTTGLYGAPSVMGNMLSFSPLSFEASKSGTGTSNVFSTLSISLVAQPGFNITGVVFEEFGDYSVAVPFQTGGGSGSISANLAATVSATNFAGNFAASSNTFPGITGAPWSISFPINFAPTPTASLSATNSLFATAATQFNDAFIKKKGFKITVNTTPSGGVIPEPTSALIFLGLGLVGITSRRRS